MGKDIEPPVGKPEDLNEVVHKGAGISKKLLRGGALVGSVLALTGEPMAALPTATLDQNGRPNIHYVGQTPRERVHDIFKLIDMGKIIPRYWNGVLVLPPGTVLRRRPSNANLGLPRSAKDNEKPFVVPEGMIMVVYDPGLFRNNGSNGEDDLYMSPVGGGDLTKEGQNISDKVLFLGWEDAQEKAKWYVVKGQIGTEVQASFDSQGKQTDLPAPPSMVAKYQLIGTNIEDDLVQRGHLELADQYPGSH